MESYSSLALEIESGTGAEGVSLSASVHHLPRRERAPLSVHEVLPLVSESAMDPAGGAWWEEDGIVWTSSLIKYAVVRSKLSGWQLEALVGHCTFAGLLRRGSISAFHCCYQFMSHSCALEVPVWGEVVAELQCFRGFLSMGISRGKTSGRSTSTRRRAPWLQRI